MFAEANTPIRSGACNLIAGIRHAFARPDVQRRGIVVAVVVGTILNLINQGPELLLGESLTWSKACLTYLVPYCVSTYSSASTIAHNKPADSIIADYHE